MTYISKISSFMQFFLSIRIFCAVFICSFSILRNIQSDSDVCHLPCGALKTLHFRKDMREMCRRVVLECASHCWDLGTTCQMRHETLDRDVTHSQQHNDGGCLYNVGCSFRKKDQFSAPNFFLINRANTSWRLFFDILFVQSVG